jgi:hypothetical protein
LATAAQVDLLLYILLARSSPSARIPNLSLSRKLPPKMVLQVYDARGSLPSSSSFLCFYSRSALFLLHGVWWAWDGSLLFFLSVATTTITHLQSVWGYYYLLPPIPHPSSTLTAHCLLIPSIWRYGLHGTMVGIIGGIGVWAEGFASTDSQSYIYLIGTSWSFVSCLLFSLVL